MSTAKEEITVKASLPPSPVQLPENNSPIRDSSVVEIKQGVPSISVPRSQLNPEERAKRKAMIVSTLERGIINDRMAVKLPDDMYGCWVRRDAFEIDQMKRLGFSIDTEFAPQRALNTDGTGAAFVGDVVHMIAPRDVKELVDEVKHERKMAAHSKRGVDKEEKDFASQTQQETGGIIPTMVESKTREARKDDIASALEAMNAQTKPQTP